MKILRYLLCALLVSSGACFRKMCTMDILRSFGYHSLIAPNRSNKLCPKLRFNCCTNHDQMQMHKTANHPFVKMIAYRRYLRFLMGIRRINMLWNTLSSINMR